MRLANAALFLAMLTMSSQSFAQVAPVPRLLTNTDLGLLVPQYRDFSSRAGPEPTVEWEISLGAGYTRGQDESKTLTSPFEVLATIAKTHTRIKIFGRGYQRTRLGAFKADGVADVTLQVLQPVMMWKRGDQDHVVLASIASNVPTATDVSANHSTRAVGLYYVASLSPAWEVWGVLNASKTNIPLPPWISDRAYSGAVRILRICNPDNHDHVRLQVQSTRRSGVRTNNAVATTYAFAVTETMGATMELTRGLTQGSRDTMIDFSLTWKF